ncbi:hypothetical protein [Hyphomicrobium sp. 99]|uniref:hypothetical protein n=1 Tax=Hyphomicrobium sp. 99 TaxID=1163419 RepID=UPI0005F7D634|nr:hypothetical protein [Hyphomicrobium sp. 99]
MKNEQKYSIAWDEIRRAYEAGTKSTRTIAKDFGVTEGAIRKRAKSDNWIRATGTHKGTQGTAYQRVRTSPQGLKDASTRDTVDRRRSAEAASPVDLSALKRQGFELIATLTRELQLYSDNVDLIEKIILEETAGDRSSRRREMLLRAISNANRMAAAKNMATAFDILYGAGPGKKEKAKEDANRVGGAESCWGDDLDPYSGEGKKPN